MPCYSPLKGFKPLSNLDGGRLVFNTKKALNPDNPTIVPCGVCIGCRIDRSRDWAARCSHEAQMHKENCFITLTFSDENLPEDYSVHVRTLQLFLKKLRKSLPQKIRFFACGEYGDTTLRPHYHALLFGHDWDDKKLWRTTQSGQALYTSEKLTALWGYGHCTSGTVTYQSAAYCARYAMKKITGEKSADHYTRIHPVTKKVVTVQPEFCTQSRRPGVGNAWFERYKSDAFPSDFIIVDGKPHPVPKFYAKKLAEEELEAIKRQRRRNALPRKHDNTPARLRVRETVKASRLAQLKREL